MHSKRGSMGKVVELPGRAIEDLKLTPEVGQKLVDIQAEVATAYRESFMEMVQTMQAQASALARIQETLRILVEQVAPQLTGQIPPAIRVATDGEQPDLASAIVAADPIGQGYSLSQTALAKALGVPPTDVSILCKCFKLATDANCAVVVRAGRSRLVNYHPRAVTRFQELLRHPPSDLDATGRAALARTRKKLGIGRGSPPAGEA